jgi:GNAT superfamily N-acetyltransferase
VNQGPRITFVARPADDEIEAVQAIIAETAEQQHPGANYRDYAFLLKDEDGEIVGGLTGYVLYGWMFVQFLSVKTELRGDGYGKSLMAEAEAWGREHKLGGMWLDTFEFQAPDFYRSLGFTEFGSIKDHPAGSRRCFFHKRFD